MSEISAPHNILHLVVEGFPIEELAEFTKVQPGATGITKIFPLTEASAPEALKSIFAADTVVVWGKV